MMTTKRYEIDIEDLQNSYVSSVAAENGATHCRFLGGNGEEDDKRLAFYAMPACQGWELRFAVTSGDVVWEDDDASAFADLVEYAGLDYGLEE